MGAATIRVIMIIALVASLSSVSHAATGTATYYTPPYVRKYFHNLLHFFNYIHMLIVTQYLVNLTR